MNSCQQSIDSKSVIPQSQKFFYQESQLAGFAAGLAGLSEEEKNLAVSEYIRKFPHTPVIESDSIFSLYWWGNASQVLVNGDLQNGWSVPDTMKAIDAGEKKFFYISYKVPSDTRIDYTLTIDSLVIIDPGNPVVTPGGYGNHSQELDNLSSGRL